MRYKIKRDDPGDVEGERPQCSYDLGFGSMIIGVSCDRLQSSLSDEGGDIYFGYSLDLNTALTSENQVIIAVFLDNKEPANTTEV